MLYVVTRVLNKTFCNFIHEICFDPLLARIVPTVRGRRVHMNPYTIEGKHMCDVCLSEFTMLSLWHAVVVAVRIHRFFAQLPNSTATTTRPPGRLTPKRLVHCLLGVFKSFFFFLAFLFFIILRCFALGSICRHLVLCLGRLINFLFCNHSRHDSCAFSVYSNSRHFLCSLALFLFEYCFDLVGCPTNIWAIFETVKDIIKLLLKVICCYTNIWSLLEIDVFIGYIWTCLQLIQLTHFDQC